MTRWREHLNYPSQGSPYVHLKYPRTPPLYAPRRNKPVNTIHKKSVPSYNTLKLNSPYGQPIYGHRAGPQKSKPKSRETRTRAASAINEGSIDTYGFMMPQRRDRISGSKTFF